MVTWAIGRLGETRRGGPRSGHGGLDHAQAIAARAVAGTDPLVVVVGPAGAGKIVHAARPPGHGLTGAGRPVFGLAPSATAAAVLDGRDRHSGRHGRQARCTNTPT